MSDTEQTGSACPATPDRRVQRTQRLLHEALGSLLHQRPYERIVVKEILARANVARSTFYAHFRDKDELLVHSIDEVLRSAEGAALRCGERHERVLAFSLPLYEHIAAHRRRCQSVKVKGQHGLHRKVEDLLAERLLAELGRERRAGWTPPVAADLLARHVAASFMRVLDWWVAQEPPLPAPQADRMFRALVVPALTGRRV